MKRLLDINTWIALTLDTHPHHAAARGWYEGTALAGGDLVFCRQTELGFLRLITQEAVMRRCGVDPLTNTEAVALLASVYANPAVSQADEPSATRSLWLQLADRPTAAPHTWMDAYLAAFSMALGAEVVTFDRGFEFYEASGLAVNLLMSP